MILRNGKLILQIYKDDKFYVFSDGVNSAKSTTIVKLGQWQLIAIKRTADGTCTFYQDCVDVTDDSSSGTPEAGDTNIIIGNSAAGTNTWDGNIPILKIVKGLLTTKQIENYFVATKHYFNK